MFRNSEMNQENTIDISSKNDKSNTQDQLSSLDLASKDTYKDNVEKYELNINNGYLYEIQNSNNNNKKVENNF